MAVLAGLGIAGLGYAAVFLPDFPQTRAHFLIQFAVKGFSALGLASLVCCFSFSALERLYRKQLTRHREALRLRILGASTPRPVPVIASDPSDATAQQPG